MTRKTRLIALIISAVMLIGMLPLSLFAEDSAVAAVATEESTVTLKGVSATLGAETALNYYVAADEAVANGLAANFTVGDKKESVKLSDAQKTADGVKVSIGLSAVELATKVTFTLTDADGATVEFATVGGAVSSYEYSVKEYALDLIASDNTDEAKEAAKALLLYGYFAETYFLGTVSTSFDGALTAEDIAAVSGGAFGAGNAEVNNVLVGDPDVLGAVYLVLDSYAKIRIEIKGDEEPSVASDLVELAIVKIDGKYHVDVLGITVSDFNSAYTFIVNGTTVKINLLAVASIVANDAATYGEAFADLAKALYNYYDATNDYKIAESRKIVYSVNGGTLPEDAPKKYDPAVGVLLPTDVTRDGYYFGGWYTSADFSGERVYYVAAGTSGVVTVYARWYTVAVDENYETTDITGAGKFNRIQYANVDSASFSVETADGNKYLSVILDSPSKDASQANLLVKDNGHIIASSIVSYEMAFSKIADVDITPLIEAQLPLVNGGSSVNIFKVSVLDDGTGEIKLIGGSKAIATIKEGVFDKIRISVDFDTKNVIAYDESYNVIDTVKLSALPDLDQINRQYHLFFYTRKPGDSTLEKTGYLIDDVKIVEGMIFEASEVKLPAANDIVYKTNYGTLPENAPTNYDPAVGVLLPTDVTRAGFVFAGWYTDASFTDESQIHYVPAGHNGVVTVYARWAAPVTDEDFTGDSFSYINGTHSQPQYQGIYYNVSNAGTSMKTVVDAETGNTYLRVDNTVSGKNGVIRVTDDAGKLGIAGFNEDYISYEFSFSKIEGVALSTVNLTLQSSGGAGGTGSLAILDGDTAGNVKLRGGSVSLGTITEGKFIKVRIGVDFAAGTVTAFDGNNNVIDSVTPTAPSGFASLAEWQRADNGLKHHVLFLSIQNKAASGTATGVLVDDIKITDGKIFQTIEAELPEPNSIVYDAGIGTLPEGAPETYDSSVDTALPVLEKNGYVFAGWYTASTFDDGTRVEKIAAGTKGTVQVYAKWLTVVTNENYTGDDFSYKNGTHGQPQYQGVYYNVSNSGTYMKTVVDPVTGNTYLRVDNTTNNKNGVIRVTDDTAKLGIAGFNESFISYEFSFSKIEGVALSNINLSLQSSGGAGGNGSVSILTSDTSGKVYLRGGSVCLGTISEGAFTKIKIGVDFATGILYAFDGENAVIDSVVLTAPSGFASLAEWQRASNGLKHHILFLSIENKASSGTATGLLVDDIKIVDGNAFN